MKTPSVVFVWWLICTVSCFDLAGARRITKTKVDFVIFSCFRPFSLSPRHTTWKRSEKAKVGKHAKVSVVFSTFRPDRRKHDLAQISHHSFCPFHRRQHIFFLWATPIIVMNRSEKFIPKYGFPLVYLCEKLIVGTKQVALFVCCVL